MNICAKKIRIEFDNSSGDYWEATSESGIVFNEAMRMIAKAWEEHDDALKEPRINDDEARDAVYSWASKLQIHQVKCKIAIRGLGVVVTTFQACSLHSAPIIEFTSLYANVVHGGTYTIDELCGEEEE